MFPLLQPARQHRTVDRGEVLLRQDDVRRLPGHVHGIARADADVGGVQGGQVVDAVAEEARRVTAVAQGRDDPGLVLGRAAREHRGPVGHPDQLLVRQGVHQVGRHHIVGAGAPLRAQTEVRAHPGGRARMVPGEHLDAHTPPRQHPQRVGGARGRDVPQCHQAHEGQSRSSAGVYAAARATGPHGPRPPGAAPSPLSGPPGRAAGRAPPGPRHTGRARPRRRPW